MNVEQGEGSGINENTDKGKSSKSINDKLKKGSRGHKSK